MVSFVGSCSCEWLRTAVFERIPATLATTDRQAPDGGGSSSTGVAWGAFYQERQDGIFRLKGLTSPPSRREVSRDLLLELRGSDGRADGTAGGNGWGDDAVHREVGGSQGVYLLQRTGRSIGRQRAASPCSRRLPAICLRRDSPMHSAGRAARRTGSASGPRIRSAHCSDRSLPPSSINTPVSACRPLS